MNTDKQYIERCLALAQNGLGTTYPNPMVGCVIVHNNQIIGEGWHIKAGQGHAEVNAIKSVKDKSILTEATIYVSLEPCSHFGKTPPCCDLIIKHKIPNVVIGTVDPNIKVAGNGIKRLIEAGVNVKVGFCEEDCNELNKRFFGFHLKKRPYIILKWAETQDGFIAPKERNENKPVWITNPYSRQLVHKWRTEEQAILIGTQTAIDDNPRLDARDWKGANPTRVVLDAKNRIKQTNVVFDGSVKTIIICGQKPEIIPENCIFETIDFTQKVALQITQILYNYQIQSVIIEGGQKTIQSFIDEELWDEARIFKGQNTFKQGTKAPLLTYAHFETQTIGQDALIIARKHD